MMSMLDADGDGVLSAPEVPGQRGPRALQMIDTNHDGVISLDELRADLDATKTRH